VVYVRLPEVLSDQCGERAFRAFTAVAVRKRFVDDESDPCLRIGKPLSDVARRRLLREQP
jgi:hypothetical protein